MKRTTSAKRLRVDDYDENNSYSEENNKLSIAQMLAKIAKERRDEEAAIEEEEEDASQTSSSHQEEKEAEERRRMKRRPEDSKANDAGIMVIGDAVLQLEDSFVANGVLSATPAVVIRDKEGYEHEVTMPFRPYEMVEGNLLPSASLGQLLEVSQVSPFGQGNVTKVDPNVRKARHVSADKIVRVAGISMEYILEQVKDRLFPFEQEIECELLKLNIYQEGDFFVPHRDTPLSERSIGSLVIALPCAHAGGQLTVKHRWHTQDFDFAREMENSNYHHDEKVREQMGCYRLGHHDKESENISLKTGLALGRICWVAFYGDCMHEIRPVTSGVRLTLSYKLLRKPAANTAMPFSSSAPAPSSSVVHVLVTPQNPADLLEKGELKEAENPEEEFVKMTLTELKALCRAQGLRVTGKKQELVDRLLSEKTAAQSNVPREFMSDELARAKAHKLVRAWGEVLQSPSFFVDGVRLGFPCFHLYESEEDLPKEQALNSRLTAEQLRLRGADALLALTAARLGLKVSIVRLTVIDDGGDGCVTAMDVLITPKNVRYLGKHHVSQETAKTFGIDLTNMGFMSKDIDVNLDIEWVFGIPGYLNGKMHEVEIPLAHVGEACVSGSGYFGNEAGIGVIYSQCAIVIDMPEVGSEERQRAVQAAAKGLPLEALHHVPKGVSWD